MEHLDVVIVGAGLIPASRWPRTCRRSPRAQDASPSSSGATIGGTWDLFRYPGVRSDSDMHTLGFRFEPWIHEKAIADGEAILEYLRESVEERGIDPHIRFGTKVVARRLARAEARWHVARRGRQAAAR